MRLLPGVVLLLLAALTSCGGDTQTALYVRVLSDLSVPDQVDVLHFQANSTGLSPEGATQSYPLTEPFPHTITLLPGNDQTARVEITVILQKGATDVARASVVADFVAGKDTTVDVTVDCGQRCQAGDGDADSDGDGDGDGDTDSDGDGDGDGDGDTDADGDADCPLDCALGCSGDAVCDEAVPSIVGRGPFAGVGADWVVDRALVANTVTGEILDDAAGVVRAAGVGVDAPSGIGFSVVAQGGGAPSLGVFVADSLTIAAGGTLSFVGANGAALLARRDLNVSGVVDAAAHGTTPGPGGSAGSATAYEVAGGTGGGGNGCTYEADPFQDCGGGGAGYGAAGGAGGGSLDPAGPGGTSGAVYGEATLSPLLGGSGGGSGGATAVVSMPGGAGGGALLLFGGGRVWIDATGHVRAGGGGGRADNVVGPPYTVGGGGGGSGGGLLLEGTEVTVDGTLSANGGGGGGGAVNNGTATPGADGGDGEERAAGGIRDLAIQDGDDGGAGGGGGTPGGDPGEDGPDGGGGGGAAGRIRINTGDGAIGGVGPISPFETAGRVGRDNP